MARKSVRDLPGEAVRKPVDAARKVTSKATEPVEDLTPTSHLQQSLQSLAATMAERALGGVTNKVSGTAERLTNYAEGGDGSGNLLAALTGVEKLAGGESPMKAAMSAGMTKVGHTVKEKLSDAKESLTGGKGKGGGGKKLKLTNIIEQIDVGVPIQLAYDEWTQFADFPKFMKKLEQVEQVSDEKLNWTGKVFWSRRSWESTIVEQVPYERIIWQSKGQKGYIDGAVTFHELTPDLTRIILVLEYHPGGVFEKTANLWRAAGRRARLELKHFQRHVMTETVLHPEDIEGWHGEIRDKQVVEENAVDEDEEEEEEEEEPEEAGEEEEGGDEEEPAGEEKPAAEKPAHKRAVRKAADEDHESTEADESAGADEAPERPAPRRKPAPRRRTTPERGRTTPEGRRTTERRSADR